MTKMEEFTISMGTGSETVRGRRLSANFFMHYDPLQAQNKISHIGTGFCLPSVHPRNIKSAKEVADDLEKVCDWSKLKRTKRGLVNKKIYQDKVNDIRAIFVNRGVPAYVLST